MVVDVDEVVWEVFAGSCFLIAFINFMTGVLDNLRSKRYDARKESFVVAPVVTDRACSCLHCEFAVLVAAFRACVCEKRMSQMNL
jgi:hypothetical protein